MVRDSTPPPPEPPCSAQGVGPVGRDDPESLKHGVRLLKTPGPEQRRGQGPGPPEGLGPEGGGQEKDTGLGDQPCTVFDFVISKLQF